MSTWSRRITSWALPAGTLLLLLSLVWSREAQAVMLEEQMAELQITPFKESIVAPDFTLITPSGGSLRLSDFKGHPVLLNFWTSW